MANIRRIAPPPSDEQLAAAEQTDNVRRRDRMAQVEDEQEQERLALAGDPEALEKVNARAAIRASASVLDSRPVGGSDDSDGKGAASVAPSAVQNPQAKTRKRRADKTRNRSNGVSDALQQRNEIHRRTRETEPPPQQEEEPDQEALAKLAYRLMDLAYKKWEKAARKNLTAANRELAFDLGRDMALYLRSGIIRMNDLHATIEKLTASAKAGKDTGDEGEEDLDDQLEDLRKAMRGE